MLGLCFVYSWLVVMPVGGLIMVRGVVLGLVDLFSCLQCFASLLIWVWFLCFLCSLQLRRWCCGYGWVAVDVSCW